LPSYLAMVKPSKRMLTPRFWLEPKYEALLCDAQGLAFELSGATVKALTEEDYFSTLGTVQHSGKASPAAQHWADMMTDKYSELAVADPIFGQLQNCMELAVVGALIVKGNLPQKAGYDMPTLMNSPELKADVFNAPKQVPSVASVLNRGKGHVISVSGGVAINSWAIADKLKTSEKVAPVRTKAAFAETAASWWRN